MAKRIYCFILLAIFVNTLFASQPLEKVSLQLHWKYQFEFAGFIAAKEKGFYKEVGLDVEFKEYSFGLDVEDEVLKGNATYGVYTSTILLSYLQGKPINLIASFFKRSAMVLVTTPNIKEPKDLIGKTVMADTKKYFDLQFKHMFKVQGVDTNKLKFVKHTYNVKDFVDKKVDAIESFISNQPYKLDKLGVEYNILDPSDYGIYNLHQELFTSKEQAVKYPIRTKAFKDATIKGWKYALEHKDEIIDIIHKKYAPHLTKDILQNEAQKIEKLILPFAYKIGSIHYDFLEKQKDIFIKEYKIKTDKKLKDFIFKEQLDSKLNLIEKKYLEDKKVIKVCANPNWTPIEFVANSKPFGISIDTLKMIQKNLNIKLEYIQTDSWSQSQQFLKEKRCDILPSAIKTAKRLEYANFTKPYLKYDLAIITQNNKPLVTNLESIINKTMSRKKGSGLIDKLKSKYPDIKILETKDYQEALERVSTGDVYFTIATLPVLSYFKNKLKLDNLQIAGYTDMKYNLSIAVRKDDLILLSILNKELSKIDPNTHNLIYEKWTSKDIEIKHDYSLIWKTLLGVLVVGSLLIYRQIKLKGHNKTLEDLNNSLESKVIQAIEETERKSKLLEEQSRLAQMGEMISMIAHQWRQPLSAINSSIIAIQSKLAIGKFNLEVAQDRERFLKFLEKKHNNITEYVKGLSETIDDFRNFFKPDKEKEIISIIEPINRALKIVEASMSAKGIKIVTNFNCKDEISMYQNELMQVVLNILKNSEDNFKEKNIQNGYIEIVTSKKDNNYIIEIYDNGGGIPEDIMPNIFDPYFSTKDEKNGTGLGLYMSKIIIEEHHNGNLSATNTYKGVCFKIELEELLACGYI